MTKDEEVLRALGRIEGRLIGIDKLSERVSKLEQRQFWMKGAWAILAGVWTYLLRCMYQK